VASTVCVDLPAEGLLMGTPSDVASERLPVLHIRHNLQENRPLLELSKKQKFGVGNAGVRMSSYSEDLHSAALAYHRLPRPGKLEIQAIKPLANQRDLALAYSPGVAAACTAIAADPVQAASLTIRANLVAVVSNGTAVLGLGNIGPLASKPVMEGKAVLFKKFD